MTGDLLKDRPAFVLLVVVVEGWVKEARGALVEGRVDVGVAHDVARAAGGDLHGGKGGGAFVLAEYWGQYSFSFWNS